MVGLAAGFARRGHSVDLVLIRARGPYLRDVPAEVRIVDLRGSRTSASVWALASYLRGQRPSALLSTLHIANVVSVVAKRVARVETRTVVRQAVMLSAQTGYARNHTARATSFLVRRAYPRADGIVAVSEAVAEDLRGVLGLPNERIRVIPNPVITTELFQLAKIPPQHPWFDRGAPPVILGVGRLTAQKDFPTLLRAFARVRLLHPCRLVVLGEGEDRQALEALAETLGVRHLVSFPGFVSNPFAFMANAAVFVSSSAWEGLPGALIQAMACGVPCVATNCPGGSREVLEGGRFGPLVPVGDASAMSAAIAATLERPRARVADVAWSRFAEAAAVDEYLQFLDGA
jgi:glycosyltransferase involved in cell wall biosynthesis